MKYTIIIPTFNHLQDCLKPCLESIIRNTTFVLNDRIVEVLVVANGCTDETEEYIKSLGKHFKIITFPEAVGYTKAVNEGIKFCKDTDYYILMNNDVQILDWGKDWWIDLLYEPFIKDKNCAVTGPLSHVCEYSREKFLIFYLVMISHETIEYVGLLDEIFSPGGCEDIDFCIRAKQLGFTWHPVPFGHKSYRQDRLHISNYPSYHVGEQTVFGLTNWDQIFGKNNKIIEKRYGNRELNYKRISIIIPTCNNFEDLKACCESILKTTELTDEIEINIVATQCTDKSEYVLSLPNNFQLLNYTNGLTYSDAINEALRFSTGDYIVLLHDDVIILDWGKNKWIDILLNSFEDKNVGLASPQIDEFFCVMMPINVIKKMGKSWNNLEKIKSSGFIINSVGENNSFPIYHKAILHNFAH